MDRMMKKILAASLTAVLALSPGCAFAEALPAHESGRYTLEEKTSPLLTQHSPDGEIQEDKLKLYFVNGGDIPYIGLEDGLRLLTEFVGGPEEGSAFQLEALSDTRFLATRTDNGAAMYVDTGEDVITFPDRERFTQYSGQRALVAPISLPEPEEIPMEQMADYLLWVQGQAEAEQAGSDGEAADEAESAGEAADEAESAGEAADEVVDAGATGEDLASAQPDENAGLFTTTGGYYLNRGGIVLQQDFSEYGIDLVSADGICALPLQTFNDLFIGEFYYHILYTGENVIMASSGCELLETRFSKGGKRAMSEAFARYNYGELCFFLDNNYGLKPEHGITTFDRFLKENTNLADEMLSTDPKTFDRALTRLVETYFDDGHSGYNGNSSLSGATTETDSLYTRLCYGPSTTSSQIAGERFFEARAEVYGDTIIPYEEVGDTAFITFDSFDIAFSDEEYYERGVQEADDISDTIDLIVYANSRIRRKGSPIRKIVLDLSNNSGGYAVAACFVLSWFLGEADVALRNTTTGAETNMVYYADVNLDHEFTEEDSVGQGYELYCMTSVNSFSCGNLVPAACRTSNRVTLIGQTSGGGSCVVRPGSTASGALFQISGNNQISIMKNGSFYNTDAGITPDVILTKPASFYDRAGLAKYLDELK